MLFPTLLGLTALLTPSDGPEVVPQEAPATEAPEAADDEAPAGPASIAWFGRLEDARAEAARTGRPILLMSAAPQCSGAPGMW